MIIDNKKNNRINEYEKLINRILANLKSLKYGKVKYKEVDYFYEDINTIIEQIKFEVKRINKNHE